MYKENEILITGSDGLVGFELKKILPNAIHISHKNFDLTNENDVKFMFYKHKPKVVIHLAARVGGILDNINLPATYFDDNILMNTFLLKYSKINNVERFIGVLSTCIYPDVMQRYPLVEEDLHSGPPQITNFSYSYAKRCMAVQIDSYNKQYGTKYNYVIPSNMYGENDKVDEIKSHFITALLVKINKAVKNGDKKITLLGDGTPLRQFMIASDLANIIKIIIDNNIYDNLNIANDENLSIDEMARLALKATNNEHLEIVYEKSNYNGQHRRDISIEKFKKVIPNYNFKKLYDGIKEIYHIYQTK